MAYYNRRRFLRNTAALGFASSTGLLSTLANSATGPVNGGSDYKALVCLFFLGGIDGHATLLPYDEASRNDLRSVRSNLFNGSNANMSFLGEWEGSGGRSFAMPDNMAGMASLYGEGKMAVVGNVGPLIEPTDRTSMENFSVRTPRSLFSHNDQQSTWMTGDLEGQNPGWGARFANRISRDNPGNRFDFSAVTATSTDSFLRGEGVQQFFAESGGTDETLILQSPSLLGSARDSEAVKNILRRHFASNGTESESILVNDLVSENFRAAQRNVDYFNAFNAVQPLNTVFPSYAFGQTIKGYCGNNKYERTVGC